jgi:2-polyprenyl-3-methyl-5-hydroxy-6-metoxy-1,4-benzoquinol methylase/uncharacterized protein YfkK (UPF0435 family)
VGNEFLRKGLDVAIKALALLDNKHIKLCVVGGVDKARYINLAKKLKVMDRLIFAGKSVEVEKYYSMADIFVFPTKYEAFSLATLEALAAGLPIIIPKVNGAKEIVIEGETGYLVSREPNAIADKVALILNSNKLERMRFNCIKLAENFTWDLNADRTLKIYEETLSERLDKAEIFCPICRSRSHRLLCIKNNYQIMYCKNCQFKYAIPRPTEKQLQSFYTEEYFNSKNSLGYNDYFSLYEKHYRDIFSQHCKWIKNYCNLNSYVLDVGCGSGYFLKALHDNGYKNLVGIDVSEYAINKNAAKNFKLFASTLNDFMENNMRFDCITMWHILEHYIDPLKEIKDCKQILNKNGYLFIEVPNVNSLGSLIKRCKWAALKPPEHLNFFSPRTACNLINKAGFEVLHCYTPYNFSLKYVPKLFFKLFGKIGLGGYVRIVAKNI